ncbi:MAG: class I SAM-dependent methyltransferase [Myxococcales bacterium]|nr:class I SAM-dependent methyltransferase [Myxococcales bacterium]
MSLVEHWHDTYQKRPPTRVTWYRAHLETSLALLQSLELPLSSAIVDVGAGASTLIDDLLDQGFSKVTAVDLSASALAVIERRLGARGEGVRWCAQDVCDVSFEPGSIDLWHDRAAFHFQVEEADKARYRAALHSALRPGGYAIVSTFAPDGPQRCSGLPTERYTGPQLAEALGLTLVEAVLHVHDTPAGNHQRFMTALMTRP